ncbi:MAG: hypothetical protein FWC41_06480 [Firmicutes bacterium]|nr:hypothetical protein [Bacillota bacterium]
MYITNYSEKNITNFGDTIPPKLVEQKRKFTLLLQKILIQSKKNYDKRNCGG